METTEETKTTRLKVAEHFYSLQGEGHSVGHPSVFLRLSGCVLECVWCDTVEVWKKGNYFDIDEMDALFRDKLYYTRIKKGAHLVITGGDPLIQQKALVEMLLRMEEFGQPVSAMFIEVETEAVLMPSPDFLKMVRQWNVSIKLTNSGMPVERRIKPEVINFHAFSNSYFKFPVAEQSDLNEVDDLVRRFRIKRNRVYLMPICNTRETHTAMSQKVAAMCMMSGYSYSPRLQLALWDQATGV